MDIHQLYSWLDDIEKEVGRGLTPAAKEHALVVSFLIRELIREKNKNVDIGLGFN